MADEKKIVSEPQKPDKTTTLEQLTLDKDGTLPAEKKIASTKAEVSTQKPSVENEVPASPIRERVCKPYSPRKAQRTGVCHFQ